MFQRNLSRYRDRFKHIKEKGLPFYVMTTDRRFFEVLQVNDNGSLTVGSELTPEQSAKGRAGLSPEKRKEIGKELLQREIFRTQESQQEAERIIEELWPLTHLQVIHIHSPIHPLIWCQSRPTSATRFRKTAL